MDKLPLLLILATCFLASAATRAQVTVPPEVKGMIDRLLQGREPDFAAESSIPGLYEVRLQGRIFYLDGQGRFMMDGTLFDLDTMKNLTEESMRSYRKQVMSRIKADDVITYSPSKTKYTVSVFTDVDCGYCRKFHSHIRELQAMGVQVRYLFAPFQGDNAKARAEAVWCSGNQRKSMDQAKLGRSIPLRRCDNPLEKHLQVVRELGINGTPSIYLENGVLIGGYLPPQRLIERMHYEGVKPKA